MAPGLEWPPCVTAQRVFPVAATAAGYAFDRDNVPKPSPAHVAAFWSTQLPQRAAGHMRKRPDVRVVAGQHANDAVVVVVGELFAAIVMAVKSADKK